MTVNSLHTRIVEVISSKPFFYIVTGWFLVQAIYIATTTKLGIPPDENYHYQFINYLSVNNLNPTTEQTGSFVLGDVQRETSYLYHWLLATINSILSFSGSISFYALRYINIAMGFASLLTLRKIGEQIGATQVVVNFTLLMLSSTIMFVFLSASISYDNLAILVSLLLFLFVVRLIKSFSVRLVLGIIALIMFGSVIKFSFMPVGLMLLLVVAYQLYKHHRKAKSEFRDLILTPSFKDAVLVIVLLFGAALFIERVGYNVVIYKDITPECDVVHTVSECEESALYKRNQHIEASIPSSKRISFPVFTAKWIVMNAERTYGVFAHKSYTSNTVLTGVILSFLFLSQLAIVRKFTYGKKEALLMLVYSIAAIYILILLLVNRDLYMAYGRFGFATQGRYLFLVLPLMYLVSAHYFRKLTPKMYGYVFTVVGVVMIMTSLPSYLLNVDSQWRNEFGNKLTVELLKPFR